MLNKICEKIYKNKNLLMFFSTSIYVLALFASLSGHVLFFLALITLLCSYLLIKNYFPLKYVLIWIILFYVGILNTFLHLKESDILLNLAPMNTEISGTIVSIPKVVTNQKIRFFLEVDKINIGTTEKELKNEKVLVNYELKGDLKELKLYNSGTFKGRLSVPFKAGNPSQFDYGNYLRNYKTYAVFYAKEFVKSNKELTLKSKIFKSISDYREKILDIHSKYLHSPNLEILGGIVFGDDAVSTPKEIKTSFMNSGLLHILAASGMNVAFIYSFFFWIFSRIKLKFRLSVILGMLMVVVYSLMTGLGPSIVRATFMLLFVLFGKLIDREAHSISLLSFVALLMLIYNPLLINDVGFQLSFIVTFGILLMSPRIIKYKNAMLNCLLATIFIPIIAQLWVIPIQIFYFNNISLYSIFANIMSVPILAIISFGGFISSLLAGIPFIADLICMSFDFILNILLNLLINISDFWGHLPKSIIQTTHPSIYQIFLYYGILLSSTGLLYKEIREKYLKPLSASLCFLLVLLVISLIPLKNSDLEIITFDVGNADSFLIKTPAKDYIMIDTGRIGYAGGKSQAEIVVLKYLKDLGIKKIDSLIITHFDNDHCGGAQDVISSVNVDKLYVNNLEHKSNAAKQILSLANKKGINTLGAKNKQVVYDKNGLMILNYLSEIAENDNEKSIITLLIYKDFKMLFTGDASAESLQSIIDKLPKDITILKVPHHGASNALNKELVDYLNPEWSIISVGENKFGHPSLYPLYLLNSARILRTDVSNSIKIVVNKSGYGIETYSPEKRKYLKK